MSMSREAEARGTSCCDRSELSLNPYCSLMALSDSFNAARELWHVLSLETSSLARACTLVISLNAARHLCIP